MNYVLVVLYMYSGSGIPNERMKERNCAARIDHSRIMTTPEAYRAYTACGGKLTMESIHGEDPLSSRPELVAQREVQFTERYPSFEPIFHSLVNGDDGLFQEGFLHFIQLTFTLM